MEASFRGNFRAVVAAAQHDDALAGIDLLDFARQQIDGAEVGGEDDDLLVRVLPPERAKPVEQLLSLGFALLAERPSADSAIRMTLLGQMQIDGG